MKKIISVVGIVFCMLSSMAQAAESKFTAQSNDANFKSLMTRWASMEGKSLEWKTGLSFGLSDPQSLNKDLALGKNTDLKGAIDATLSILKQAYPQEPLQSCYFDKKVVVVSAKDECKYYKGDKLYYIAEYNDKSVKALVERWAAREGVKLMWQAKVDYPIDNYTSFNWTSTLPSSTALNFGVHKVLKFINLIYPNNINVKECMLEDAIVIRPVFASCEG